MSKVRTVQRIFAKNEKTIFEGKEQDAGAWSKPWLDRRGDSIATVHPATIMKAFCSGVVMATTWSNGNFKMPSNFEIVCNNIGQSLQMACLEFRDGMPRMKVRSIIETFRKWLMADGNFSKWAMDIDCILSNMAIHLLADFSYARLNAKEFVAFKN